MKFRDGGAPDGSSGESAERAIALAREIGRMGRPVTASSERLVLRGGANLPHLLQYQPETMRMRTLPLRTK
jgi:hypothetical protein